MSSTALPIVDTELHGWEHRTRYLLCDRYSRNQAKSFVWYEEAVPYTDLRCRRVWLCYREVSEDEAAYQWVEDWEPGVKFWIGCKPEDEGAMAWWEVTWPRD